MSLLPTDSGTGFPEAQSLGSKDRPLAPEGGGGTPLDLQNLGLQPVLNALPANVAILDPDGVILTVNEGWSRFSSSVGADAPVHADPGSNYLAVCRVAELSGEASAGLAACGIDSVLKGRQSQFAMHYPCDGPDAPRWCSMIVTPLGEFQPRGALVQHFDITAQHQTEMDLARQLESLSLESRLHTLSELASGITHEITQPLTAISHYCDAVQFILDGPGEHWMTAAGLIGRIQAQTERAVDVVSRLRDFMRSMTPNLQVLSVEDLLHDSVGLAELGARQKNVRLRVLMPQGLPAVSGDATQLKQVLLHLLRNAIEAAGSVDADPRTVTIVAGSDPGWVRISVKDNGPALAHGWSTDLLDAIRDGDGYIQGLELGISQSIVRAHGGKLWLDTMASQGSCFHFTLPMAGESHAF
jgi:two-component system, LuxR family, sensor kinase FixL